MQHDKTYKHSPQITPATMRLWKLAVLTMVGGQTAAAQGPVYRASSSSPDMSLYQIDGDSTPLNADAILRIRSLRDVPPRSSAAFNLALAADTLVYRYVTLSAELKATLAPQGARLWAIVAGAGGIIAAPDTREQAVRGTTDWTPVARNVRLVAAPRILAAASPIAQAYLDSAVALAKGATTSKETHEAIRYLLARLGDHHSFLSAPNSAGANLTPNVPTAATFPAVDVRRLGDGIVRVSMPSYTSTDSAISRQYVTQLHASLTTVRRDASCGWVLDLRNNAGGNMWPMLAGLNPFLGDGPLGFFTASHSRVNCAGWTRRRSRCCTDLIPRALAKRWRSPLSADQTRAHSARARQVLPTATRISASLAARRCL